MSRISTCPSTNAQKNAPERSIYTWKNHFIARLCGVGKLSPMHIWCLLLQQVQITMNLLRTSIPNPKLLDHGALEVMFDFNKKKLAPLGTKVIVHKKPG